MAESVLPEVWMHQCDALRRTILAHFGPIAPILIANPPVFRAFCGWLAVC